MSKQLKQVINLSKKTGDRIIVFDNSDPDDSFVVLSLEQYEGLIDNQPKVLTDKKIIDNIDNTTNNNNNNSDNSFKNNRNNWSIPKEVKEESEE